MSVGARIKKFILVSQPQILERLAFSRQFNQYGSIGARDQGTGIAQVFSVGANLIVILKAYLFTKFNYDPLGAPAIPKVTVSIREVDGSNYPTGPDLVSNVFWVSDGVLVGGDDSSFKVYRNIVSLPLELAANTNYALVMLSTIGRTVYHINFRHIGWLTKYPKDSGSSNYVICKLTEDAGITWDDWTQDYMCFELLGQD